jgi:uncharacterized protein
MLFYRIVAIACIALLAAAAFGGTMEEGIAAKNTGDFKSAWSILQPLAVQGQAQAQVAIGEMYQGGQGIAQNPVEAVKWFRLAADQGNAVGQNNMGHHYFMGLGVFKDPDEAQKWFQLAATQGNLGAQNRLGHMYYTGDGAKRDYEQALKFSRLAAEQGSDISQMRLAAMYYEGHGVTKNPMLGLMWANISAMGGHPNFVKGRDMAAKQASAEQNELAINMANKCKQSNYKDCG